MHAINSSGGIVTWTGITWGSGDSGTWWVGNTWYDGDTDGTGTHETPMGPLTSFTMKRRARLRVTTAPIPDHGGTDDPDRTRVYLGRGSTQPATAALFRQATTAPGEASALLTTVAFSGATLVPVPFPAADPAALVSTALAVDGAPMVDIRADGYARINELMVAATSDVNTSPGNKPPLRVGNPTGTHLRVDGNEIAAMSSDSTQGTLLLNIDGAVNIGGGGTSIQGIDFGTQSVSLGGSGNGVIAHNLGVIPSAFVAVSSGSHVAVEIVARTASSVTVQCWSLDNTLLTSTSRNLSWIAIA
jgi:hypothetical protein